MVGAARVHPGHHAGRGSGPEGWRWERKGCSMPGESRTKCCCVGPPPLPAPGPEPRNGHPPPPAPLAPVCACCSWPGAAAGSGPGRTSAAGGAGTRAATRSRKRRRRHGGHAATPVPARRRLAWLHCRALGLACLLLLPRGRRPPKSVFEQRLAAGRALPHSRRPFRPAAAAGYVLHRPQRRRPHDVGQGQQQPSGRPAASFARQRPCSSDASRRHRRPPPLPDRRWRAYAAAAAAAAAPVAQLPAAAAAVPPPGAAAPPAASP